MTHQALDKLIHYTGITELYKRLLKREQRYVKPMVVLSYGTSRQLLSIVPYDASIAPLSETQPRPFALWQMAAHEIRKPNLYCVRIAGADGLVYMAKQGLSPTTIRFIDLTCIKHLDQMDASRPR